MSQCLDVLLADTKRMLERRAKPAPVVHVSRADQIIAEGDRKRLAYRALNLTADTAMVYGAQIGYLHGTVRLLCNELEALNIKRDPGLGYCTVFCDELNTDVVVGFDYQAGEESKTYGPPEDCYEGSPEELDVSEVWVNGADIAPVLMERVIEQLQEAALNRVHAGQEAARDRADADRAEARAEWA